MTDIDPNLWASIARDYLGGIRAPVPGQEGYAALVDDTGRNLEYLEIGSHNDRAGEVSGVTTLAIGSDYETILTLAANWIGGSSVRTFELRVTTRLTGGANGSTQRQQTHYFTVTASGSNYTLFDPQELVTDGPSGSPSLEPTTLTWGQPNFAEGVRIRIVSGALKIDVKEGAAAQKVRVRLIRRENEDLGA